MMKQLSIQPTLSERVHEAILSEISSGKLRPGGRIIQEQIATALGVSRQPVQQALALLRKQGLLQDAPGRGLIVAPIDPEHVAQMSDLRAVIEGLACRRAAENVTPAARREGAALIRAGRKAVAEGAVGAMVEADIALHDYICRLSGNALIAPALETHWAMMRRVMGEVLMREEKPRDIWDQHETIVEAISAGDAENAERLARQHIVQAADFMIQRLSGELSENEPF